MESLKAVIKHPDELYPLLKLKMVAKKAEKQTRTEPHWIFCYSILPKVSKSYAFVIQQLSPEFRDVVCILYLVLRALDTIEDDTSIATEIKVPILKAFHRHIYNRDWHFSCGTKDCKVLMDQFHHVSTALLELNRSHQEAIEDITMRTGTGMAKFICKQVETVDDYDEYCYYVAGLIVMGLSNLLHPSHENILFLGSISNSVGLFLQKVSIIRDYLEDINETPKPRMFWPHQIWSKYANKLEDFKHDENSEKAVQCLNDMVTNALMHVEECLKCMSQFHDPTILRFYAIPQIVAFGTLSLCYNNIQVFKGEVKLRRGLTAKVIDKTKTIADVYRVFYDFSLILKSKIDMSDPNAKTTITRIEAIQKVCRDSRTLIKRNTYVGERNPSYNGALDECLPEVNKESSISKRQEHEEGCSLSKADQSPVTSI